MKDSSLLVKYTDGENGAAPSRTSGEPVTRTVMGVQASGAIRGEWEDWLIEARLNSSFTPVPDFNPSARVEWRAHGVVTAGVMLSFNVRYLMLKHTSPDAKVNATETNETVLFYSGVVF